MYKSYKPLIDTRDILQKEFDEGVYETARRQQEFNSYKPTLDQAQKDFSALGQQTQGYMGDYQTALGRTDQVNNEIARSYTEPDYWQKNSVLAGLNDAAVNDTTRRLSAQGYNMSGNVPMEVAQRLQQVGGQYVPQFQQNMLGASAAANNAAQGRLGAVTAGQQNQNLSLGNMQQTLNSRGIVNQNINALTGGLNALTGAQQANTGNANALQNAINGLYQGQNTRVSNLNATTGQANSQLQGIQGQAGMMPSYLQGLDELLKRQQLGYNNVSQQQNNMGTLANMANATNQQTQTYGNLAGAQFNPAQAGPSYLQMLTQGTNSLNNAAGQAGASFNITPGSVNTNSDGVTYPYTSSDPSTFPDNGTGGP